MMRRRRHIYSPVSLNRYKKHFLIHVRITACVALHGALNLAIFYEVVQLNPNIEDLLIICLYCTARPAMSDLGVKNDT